MGKSIYPHESDWFTPNHVCYIHSYHIYQRFARWCLPLHGYTTMTKAAHKLLWIQVSPQPLVWRENCMTNTALHLFSLRSHPLPFCHPWSRRGRVLQLSLLYAFLLPRRHWPCLLSWAGRATVLPRSRSSKTIPAAEPVWCSRLGRMVGEGENEPKEQKEILGVGSGLAQGCGIQVAPSLIRSPGAENLELESWFHTRMPKIRGHLGS